MHLKKKQKQTLMEIIKFLFTGGSTVLLQYILLIAMVEWLNINYLIATTLSVLVSTSVNYIVQKTWAFHSNADIKKSALRYLLVFAWNYISTIAFMYIAVEWWHWNYIVAFTFTIIATAIWTYYLYKYYVYAKK